MNAPINYVPIIISPISRYQSDEKSVCFPTENQLLKTGILDSLKLAFSSSKITTVSMKVMKKRIIIFALLYELSLSYFKYSTI